MHAGTGGLTNACRPCKPLLLPALPLPLPLPLPRHAAPRRAARRLPPPTLAAAGSRGNLGDGQLDGRGASGAAAGGAASWRAHAVLQERASTLPTDRGRVSWAYLQPGQGRGQRRCCRARRPSAAPAAPVASATVSPLPGLPGPPGLTTGPALPGGCGCPSPCRRPEGPAGCVPSVPPRQKPQQPTCWMPGAKRNEPTGQRED
jgi:hypothetical protein